MASEGDGSTRFRELRCVPIPRSRISPAVRPLSPRLGERREVQRAVRAQHGVGLRQEAPALRVVRVRREHLRARVRDPGKGRRVACV